MENGTCVECSAKLPPAYAATTCEKCMDAFARIRAYAEANGTNAPPAQPLAPEQPVIRYGNVLMTLGQEINIAAQQLAALKRFEQRVIEAAKSPAAWLALREELGK